MSDGGVIVVVVRFRGTVRPEVTIAQSEIGNVWRCGVQGVHKVVSAPTGGRRLPPWDSGRWGPLMGLLGQLYASLILRVTKGDAVRVVATAKVADEVLRICSATHTHT